MSSEKPNTDHDFKTTFIFTNELLKKHKHNIYKVYLKHYNTLPRNDRLHNAL